MNTIHKVLAVGSALVILVVPFSMIYAFKSRKLGMRYMFRFQLMLAIGLPIFAIGQVAYDFGLRSNMLDVVRLLGWLIWMSSYLFKRRASQEQKAYRNGTSKPDQPLTIKPANSWPPAPANGDG